MAIDFASDPLLAFTTERTAPAAFLDSVRAAAFSHPDVGAAAAATDEARAVRSEVRAGLFPQLNAQLIAARSVASDFGSFTALVESLQPSARSDLQLSADQLLFDFGATGQRIASASANVRAARAARDAQASATAVAAIAAWYDVRAGRAEAVIAEAQVARLTRLRDDSEERRSAGLGSAGDVARADAGLADAAAARARTAIALADAGARFRELFGHPAPAMLVPAAPPPLSVNGNAGPLARSSPAVTAAEARSSAAAALARATRDDRLPRLSAGLVATRYDVFDRNHDYDVRAQLTLRIGLSLGGAEAARARQAEARARTERFVADAVAQAAERDADTADATARILDRNLTERDAAYRAARRARDATAEGYRLAGGSILDVLRVEQDYAAAAAALVRSTGERDVARYVLLARTGRLLPLLGENSDGVSR